MKKKKDPNIEITELFMATAGGDFSCCFHGTIRRGTDANGEPVVYGKIKVGDGFVVASAIDQQKLGARLDSTVLVVLELSLHSDAEKSKPNGTIDLN